MSPLGRLGSRGASPSEAHRDELKDWFKLVEDVSNKLPDMAGDQLQAPVTKAKLALQDTVVHFHLWVRSCRVDFKGHPFPVCVRLSVYGKNSGRGNVADHTIRCLGGRAHSINRRDVGHLKNFVLVSVGQFLEN